MCRRVFSRSRNSSRARAVAFAPEGKTPGADPVIVLGYGFWSSQLGADPNVVGKKALVNGHPFTIVGVAPKDFHGLSPLLDMQAYVPYAMAVTLGESPDLLDQHKERQHPCVGPVETGVSISGARAALAVEASRLAQQFPDVDRDLTISGLSRAIGSARSPIGWGHHFRVGTLPGFGGTRASAGVHECGESTAGARHGTPTRNGDSRCARQFACTARSAYCYGKRTAGCAGGAVGVFLANGAATPLGSLDLHTSLPLAVDFSFDWRVFAFSFGVALFTGILVGIVPALRAGRTDLSLLCANRAGRSPPDATGCVIRW